MTIQIDKHYRTRKGLSVRLLAVDLKSDYPVVAIVSIEDEDTVFSYTQEGMYHKFDDQSEYDLIEYTPPVVVSHWVNLYPTGSIAGMKHGSRAEADAYASDHTRIGLLRRDTITHPDGNVEYKVEIELP